MNNFEKLLNLKEIVKSVLFVAGNGLEKDFVAEKLEISNEEMENVLIELKKDFPKECGIQLVEFKNKIQFSSNKEYAGVINEILNPVREKSLTRAALETLAIIVYKQPIAKIEIEDIRRVNCDYAIQVLVDQGMIEIVGRKDSVGQPFLFGTSENFLKRFNIKSIEDLPDYNSLLERIKVIREEEDNGGMLFKDTENINFEENNANDKVIDENLKDEDFFEKI